MIKIFYFGIIIIYIFCISGCVNTSSQYMEDIIEDDYIMDRGPSQGGTLNMFTTKPDTLNPILTKNIYAKDVLRLVFDGLIELNESQIPIPCIAESWTVSDDGLMWTFKIRDDITWHDGTKLTAQDVEYTFGVISNPSTNSIYKHNIDNVDKFAIKDKNMFKIKLKEPNSFTAELMGFPIIPKHYYTGNDVLKLKSSINLKPIGSGPYKFSKLSDKDINFERYDEWWGKNILEDKDKNNMPYISKIKAKIFDNEKESVNAYLTKKIDTTTVSINESGKYSIRSDTTLKKFTGNEFTFLALNLNNLSLRNKDIRQAMAYAIDKTKIIDDIFPGEAIAADIAVFPGSWILKGIQEPFYKYDLQKAQKILADGGWYKGKENLVNNSKGGTISANFNLIVNKDNSTRVLIADYIKKQLEELGIKINVTSLTWEEALSYVKSGDYEIALLGCNVTEALDLSYLYSAEQIGNFNIAN
ncbi:MAG: peptide ABC transporter substrate-binding protein, partial [Clostridiales bacterium]